MQSLTRNCTGSIVPISMGRMRNEWFPRKVAEYITQPELRTLRLNNTSVERDVEFGNTDLVTEAQGVGKASAKLEDASSFTVRKGPEVEKVDPVRSMQLIDIFVPKTLDFYRQPIADEPKDEGKSEPVGTGAAAELFAARRAREEKLKASQPKDIYGSVSTHDIMVAVRAAMENNDEAARVTVSDTDIKFVDAGVEIEATGRVKHLGSFSIEIMVKGADAGLRRTVRVNAQEA